MRIAYISHTRFPTEKAHGRQIAEVCAALTTLGHDVTLYAPRAGDIPTDPLAAYGLSKKFPVIYPAHRDAWRTRGVPGFLAFALNGIFFARALVPLLQQTQFDVLYTRSAWMLLWIAKVRVPVILELHSLPARGKNLFVRLCRRCAFVVCLTSSMKTTLTSWGVPEEKLIVEGDAVDLHRFQSLPSLETSRAHFGLQTPRIVVGYIGRLKTLGKEKGVIYLLQALQKLQTQKKYLGFIVGGPEADRTEYEYQAKALGLTPDDVVFTGAVPVSDVPQALAACDVFVMPFPDIPHYRHNMSPLKMFEYMAASRPIITSDLPTVRDVLSEETAFFCTPDDLQNFIAALEYVATHPEEAARRTTNARVLVDQHSWEKRMERILQHLKRN